MYFIMKIKKVHSKSIILHEETEVKFKTAGNTREVQFSAEIDVVNDFPNYSTQKSFIDGKEVPYGTKGSVRPDFYTNASSIDIKNYNVTTSSGRSNLASNIKKQYLQRLDDLPAGTKQSVMIDIRGQNVSDEALESLYNNIMKRTNNGVDTTFKTK